MDELMPGQVAPQIASDDEAELMELIAEMRILNEKMQQDRFRIEQLKLENKRLKEQTRAKLIDIGARF